MLNLSNIKMIPQYCSYGSAGVPAMPATISMSEIRHNMTANMAAIAKLSFNFNYNYS